MKTRKKLLVVDDMETARQWTKLILEAEGFEVIAIENPILVTTTVFRERPDLVLLDVSMPLMRGDSLVKIMKGAPHSPIWVLYSSAPEEELAALARASGADGFLKKTSDPQELVRQVKAFFKGAP
jgi:two-component system OmpR family response regulator